MLQDCGHDFVDHHAVLLPASEVILQPSGYDFYGVAIYADWSMGQNHLVRRVHI